MRSRYGSWGHEVRLFEAYLDWLDGEEADQLQESGTSTDFANYMTNVLGKRLMQTYAEVPSVWETYTTAYTVNDFKPISFYGLTEGQDLLPFEEGGEYKDSQIAERVGAKLTVRTFGRLFSLSRKALINDDLNLLRDAPGRMGRAARRSISRYVVNDTLEANPAAYDGTALFHANHNNLITDALSESGLGNAALKLAAQTDDNGLPIAITAAFLVIPGALEITARRILNSTEIHIQGNSVTAPAPSTTAVYGMGNANVMQGFVPYVVERWLTDQNDWYLFGNPADAPTIAVGFLNGARTPQIMLRDPGMRLVLGGSDPYTMEFDEIWWKIRHEWGTAVVDWRGAVKAAVA